MPLRWPWMTARRLVAVYVLALFNTGLTLIRIFVHPLPHVFGLHLASLALTGVVLALVTIGYLRQPRGA